MPSPQTTLQLLWLTTQLPASNLKRIIVPNSGELLPTSFNLTTAAQASIAACIGIAAEITRMRQCKGEDGGDVDDALGQSEAVKVVVEGKDAVAEFRSSELGQSGGEPGRVWDPLAGQYPAGPTSTNWLRPHLNFPHHRNGLLDFLKLSRETTTKQELALALRDLDAHKVADQVSELGLCMTSLRGFTDWDLHEQGQVASDKGGGPIPIYKLNDRPPKPFWNPRNRNKKLPLQGVKVLDLTRVIAGPTAGKTLASYGADVLWINAPHNPKLPGLDFETSRNKRSIQLDLRQSNPIDRSRFEQLIQKADVLLQAYRPNGLTSLGYSVEECLKINPDLVYASLSAWGEEGPWKDRKGFDSLVQFAVGFNEAEGRAFEQFEKGDGVEVEEGKGQEPRKWPCQALDYSSGFLLAFGIQAALYHRALTGGAYYVENSLLGTATWIRGLGRAPLNSFRNELETFESLDARGRISQTIGLGGERIEYVKHAPKFENAGGEEGEVDLEVLEGEGPKGYDSHETVWLDQ